VGLAFFLEVVMDLGTRDPTELFDEHLQAAVERNKGMRELRAVGGNLLIVVPRLRTWTVVTSGPRTGVYAGITDDVIHCAFMVDAETLGQILSGEVVDLDACFETGRIDLEGDPRILQRLLALRSSANALSVRCA
jgi:hypothetical protein